VELREWPVKIVLSGDSRHGSARRVGLGASTVIQWLASCSKTGLAAAAKFDGYRKPKIVVQYQDWLVERLKGGDFPFKILSVGRQSIAKLLCQ
jgi:transposase